MNKWRYIPVILFIVLILFVSEISGQCQYIPLSGKLEELEKISFIDSMNGMIGTWEGVVLRTSDGGYTWLEQDIRYGTSLRVHAVSMADSSVAYAVTSEGEVFKTLDGGASWVSKGWPTGSYLYAVSFIDANHGSVTGGYGEIGCTTDGGNSWTLASLGGDITFYNIAYVDSQTIFAVGSRGVIARSTNAGLTWSLRFGIYSDVYRSLSFKSNNLGYIVGYSGLLMPLILKTTDGGTTWSTQSTVYDKTLSDVSFLDSSRGVACGDGSILSTLDGGMTWQIHPLYGYKSIHHIRYLLTGDIIAVGDHNSLKNSIIKISKDGCSSPYTLISPKNFTENVSLWKNSMFPKSVTFSWRFYSQVRLSSAHLQIARDEGFSSDMVVDTLIMSVIDEGDTSVIIPGLSPQKMYYWRLAFRHLDGTQTDWSNVNQFTTAGGLIKGIVFEDADRDSVRDNDEPALSNWPLQISGTANVSLNSDENGYYEVVGLDSGSYTVRDLGSPLWRRIKPDSGYYRLTLPLNDTLEGFDFGYYFPWNSISGYVFNDKNEDGTKAEGDSGLPFWRVRFAGPLGHDSTLTDVEGHYSFLKVSTGSCTVNVGPPSGWEQIYPRLGRGYYHYFYDYDQQLMANFSFHTIPQRVKNLLSFHDNRFAPIVKLQWGVREGATNGIWGADPISSLVDYSEGELEIPPPLPGAMDARFVSPPNTAFEFGLGSWIDMRPYLTSSQADTYLVRFSAGTYEGGDFPVTFCWSSAAIEDAYSNPVWFSVPPELTVDMRDYDSIVISDPDLSVIRIIASSPIIKPEGVDQTGSQIPSEYVLEQNYPNPFNPLTTFRFALPQESYVLLKIYDILGREIKRLVEGVKPAGIYTVDWDATGVGSGIYLYRLEAAGTHNPKGTFIQAGKMLLMK